MNAQTSDFSTPLNKAFADIARYARPLWERGKVADYIPALAKVAPHQFGLCIAHVNGEYHEFGDSRVPFSIQSISKLFTLALLIRLVGDDVWNSIGRDPTNSAFNSLGWLESENGKPYNPFVNAGALAVTDRIMNATALPLHSILQHIRNLAQDQSINVDDEVSLSERATCDRNSAIAHLMKSYGTITGPVDALLDLYCDQCAIEIDCRQLATAGLLFAKGGVDAGGDMLLDATNTHRINALQAIAGMYDAAGEFAFRVGLPAKSGVGGGILATVPGKMSIAVWGPALDGQGNSIVGMKALEILAEALELSVYRPKAG